MSHTRWTALVDRMIKKEPSTVTVTIRSQSGYDADTGRNITTDRTFQAMCYLTQYTTSDLIEGVIKMGDMRCFIISTSKIRKGDTVTYNGVDMSVLNVNTLSTQNKAIRYELHLRAI